MRQLNRDDSNYILTAWKIGSYYQHSLLTKQISGKFRFSLEPSARVPS